MSCVIFFFASLLKKKNREELTAYVTNSQMVNAGETHGSHLPVLKEESDMSNEIEEEISEETKKEEMKYLYNLSRAKLMFKRRPSR